eukprot:351001-Prorocentrum_lima.AAC.1
MTPWKEEAQLLLNYYGRPLDAYTFEISSKKNAVRGTAPKRIWHCWTQEQKRKGARSSDDAEFRSARIKHAHA